MGLDIVAYEQVELAEAISLERMREIGWKHPLYDGKHVYLYGWHAKSSGAKEGFYLPIGKEFRFRAGSYGGYDEWRQMLARLVDTTPQAVRKGHVPPAFGELIGFSSDEGAIDAAVSAKLAKDFAEWRDRAPLVFRDKWDLERYADWRSAFELASRQGAVKFW